MARPAMQRPVQRRFASVQLDLPDVTTELMTELEMLKAKLNKSIEDAHRTLAYIQTLRPEKGEVGGKGEQGASGATPIVDHERIVSEVVKRMPAQVIPKVPKKEHIVAEVLRQLPTPKDAELVDHSQIAADVIKEILDKKLIKSEHVSGLEETLTSYRSQFARGGGYVHGGGDTVKAGPNVTITPNTDGTKTISATGGGTLSVMVPTGVVDGSNKTFVFTAAPSIIVLDNGNQMNKVSVDLTVNWTGTTTVVLTQAPNFNIYGF